eukprot:159718-Pyramimonas_sp.AAC.1
MSFGRIVALFFSAFRQPETAQVPPKIAQEAPDGPQRPPRRPKRPPRQDTQDSPSSSPPPY